MRHTITEETATCRQGLDDNAPQTRRTVRHVFEGRAIVSLCRSSLEVSDPYGDDNRQTVAFYSDSGVIGDAVVDWLHSMHREVQRARENGDLEGNRSASSCFEMLQRVAGELGLSYDGGQA